MVNNNNNTAQKTTVTVSTSESSIYLKRSELPKNVSSFKNDVGYISASTLDSWLKSHSYLSKQEIDTLISRANLVVIDTVNKSSDAEALNRLENKISDMAGEIVAIKDRLSDVEYNFIPSSKEGQFATKSEIRTLNNKMTSLSNEVSNISIDTSNLATKDEIPSVEGLASKDWVNGRGFLTKHQSLSGYAKVSDIPDVSGFITRDDLPDQPTGLATQEWVRNQKYLTKHQSLSGYAKTSDIPDVSEFAKKSDIPSLSGLATQDWVNNKGYLTESKASGKFVKTSDLKKYATQEWVGELLNNAEELDMSGFAKKTDLMGLVSSSSLSSTLAKYAKKTDLPDTSQFITKTDIPSVEGLASQSWVKSQGYLTEHQSLTKYAKKTDLPDTSQFVTRDEIPSVDGLATQAWVKDQGYLTEHQSLAKYAKKTDLDKYATQDWVAGLIGDTGEIDLSGFAKKTDLNDYVKTTALTTALKKYAKQSDIPSLDGFATQAWVQDNFLSEEQDMSGYVKTETLADYVKKTTLSSTLGKYAKVSDVYNKSYIENNFLTQAKGDERYSTKEDTKRTYLSKIEAKEYLKIEDYRGLKEMVINEQILKDALVINNDFIDFTESEFRDYVEGNPGHEVANGFYLIENDQMCVVHDNHIMSVINNPHQTATLEWKWEE